MKKRIGYSVLIAVVLVLIAPLFVREKGSLKLPNREDVTDVVFRLNGEGGEGEDIIVKARDQIGVLYAALSRVQGSSNKSVNDHPQADGFLRICIRSKNLDPKARDIFFLFEKEGKYYVEPPYDYIYSVGKAEYDAIYQIFEEGK